MTDIVTSSFSFNTVVASGATQTIAVTFKYLDKADLHVSIDAVLVDDAALTFDDDFTIRLPTIPSAGAVIKVFRDTAKADLDVRFETPSVFDGDVMNLALTQLLYIAQEAFDLGILPQGELDAIIAHVNQTAQDVANALSQVQVIQSAINGVQDATRTFRDQAQAAAAAAQAVAGFNPANFLQVANALSELSANKAAARGNIGAADAAAHYLLFDAQTLTGPQQAQVRTNLGLAAAALKAITTLAQLRAGNANQDVIENDVLWHASEWVDLGNVTGSVTVDLDTGFRFKGVLTGNLTVDVIHMKNGQPVQFHFLQDGTGSRTVSWNATHFLFLGGTAPTASTAANSNAVMVSGTVNIAGTAILASGSKFA
jgi:tail fiber protein